MGSYIIRRLLLIIPTVFLVTLIIFFLSRFIPGSVVDLMLSQQQVTQYTVAKAELEHRLGLDLPVHVQYGKWLWNALQGNLGNSLWTQTSVLDEIIRRFPVSFELGLLALITSLIVAMPIGIFSAIRQDTTGDYFARSFSITLIALPAFWIGTLVIVLPSIWWHWAPPLEYVPFTVNPIRNIEQFILPSIVLGMSLSGITMRMTRTMMLEVLRQDYVRTAWSKGLKERTVVMRHALKNAMIPVVTIVGLQLPILIGGSVIMEQIFALPGIGRLLIDVINKRDYAMLSGLNLVMAILVMLINLLVDLTYAYLDPRVHYR